MKQCFSSKFIVSKSSAFSAPDVEGQDQKTPTKQATTSSPNTASQQDGGENEAGSGKFTPEWFTTPTGQSKPVARGADTSSLLDQCWQEFQRATEQRGQKYDNKSNSLISSGAVTPIGQQEVQQTDSEPVEQSKETAITAESSTADGKATTVVSTC